ncbi:MAG TPA: heat-inducible transcriptional repressor HrcA [Bacteroidota bacterium]|nr:heat-inducible transcriptional repressor HrcA [Bacteroidota bacterium]
MPGELTDRERTVLRYVIHDFIETATPIGSRYISKRHDAALGLSSASIRNVMSDLEYMGYINHPHTSAGRVPTDLGYRFYLDSLMRIEQLSEKDQQAIRKNLDSAEETDALLRESSRILGRISHQLCIVTPPHLNSGTFEKMELVPLTGNRIMVIISIKSGLVRTIMMEVASEIPRERLEDLGRFLNDRLSGLTLEQIRESFVERVKDARNEETGLIRLFIDSVDKLFVANRSEKLHIAGTEGILDQPEFLNPKEFRSVIELINNEEIIIHVLEKNEARPNEIRVTIGEENEDEKMKPYSVITSTYNVGDVVGTIGVIGPTRMHYSRMIPLIDYVARTISEMFTNSTRT